MSENFDTEDELPPSRRGFNSKQFWRNKHTNTEDFGDEDFDDDFRPKKYPYNNLGIASMIVGILSVCLGLASALSICCFLLVVAAPLAFLGGATAVVLGFLSRKTPSQPGFGLTGIITGFVAILLALATSIGMYFLYAAQLGRGGFGQQGF